MTPEQIYEFLESALPGDTLVYHNGYLARDRADMITGKPKTHEQRHVDTSISNADWQDICRRCLMICFLVCNESLQASLRFRLRPRREAFRHA